MTAKPPYDSQAVADAVLARGWAKVQLDEPDRIVLSSLLETSAAFFSRPESEKHAHVSDGNHGYRAMGVEYSLTPERPDVNESISLWSDRLDLIPRARELGPIAKWLVAWQSVVAGITAELLGELAARFAHPSAVPFRAASSVQINQYALASPDRECLQDRHEDGHIVTLVHGAKPGLELFLDGEVVPIATAEDELVVMPGSVLTMLTGGAVEPMYHQVRNLGLPDRRSVMYFVNPEMNEPILPWVGKNHDLREAVRSSPNSFGLPDTPVL
jgi:isopenicillin N synthase-like dioxygenase